MNNIILKGIIRNIQPSHTIKNVDYDKAELIVKRKDGKEDLLNLRFKKYTNKYKDLDEINITGNVRSYSQQLSENKNKVEIYVYTYFDLPEDTSDEEITNQVVIDGRVCKIDHINKENNKPNLHFILANNMMVHNNTSKINNYIPVQCWNEVATCNSDLKVNDKVIITGELHSREYKKQIDDENYEVRVAHEIVAAKIEVVKE